MRRRRRSAERVELADMKTARMKDDSVGVEAGLEDDHSVAEEAGAEAAVAVKATAADEDIAIAIEYDCYDVMNECGAHDC
jgi:hypothetical protein